MEGEIEVVDVEDTSDGCDDKDTSCVYEVEYEGGGYKGESDVSGIGGGTGGIEGLLQCN